MDFIQEMIHIPCIHSAESSEAENKWNRQHLTLTSSYWRTGALSATQYKFQTRLQLGILNWVQLPYIQWDNSEKLYLCLGYVYPKKMEGIEEYTSSQVRSLVDKLIFGMCLEKQGTSFVSAEFKGAKGESKKKWTPGSLPEKMVH